jgi:hypothetical protein
LTSELSKKLLKTIEYSSGRLGICIGFNICNTGYNNRFIYSYNFKYFAILGLRSLYLLLAGMMEKFYYLKPGLALILFFVGSKMLISEFFEISIGMSLIVIF